MSISEVLLFIATNSRICMSCMEFIRRYNLPIEVVRLDSEESRTAAANGTYFQVTVVPTMVVIYEDGNTQLFIGAPKITQWLTMLISNSNSKPEQEKERGVTSYMPAGGNMYGPKPNPPRRKYQPDPYDEVDPELRSRPSRILVEEDEPEQEAEPEEVEQPRKKSSKSKSTKKVIPTPQKKKRKKKPPVDFEESEKEVEIEYIEDHPPPSSPPQKRPPSRMHSIYANAKKMEQDRKASLGYKEEDLPHY